MSILGSIANGIFGLVGGYATHKENERNRQFAAEQAEIARRENYNYGEMSADAADARQRAQFADMFSPTAQMRLIKEAGLSPSIMYQGTGVQGQATGQQGGGANGPSTAMPTIFNPVQGAMQAAQLGQINAQTDLLKAQAIKVDAETELTQEQKALTMLEEQIKNIEYLKKSNEYDLLYNITYTDTETGKKTSLFEAAEDSKDFNSFLQWVRTAHKNGENEISPSVSRLFETNEGINFLKNIFEDSRKFGTNIQTLQTIKIESGFQEQVVKELAKTDFAELNAKEAVQRLRQGIETEKLNETQKKAWNRLLDRLEDGTTKDILIVVGMMLNNALTNYNMPSIMNSNKTANNYISAQNTILN